MTLLPQISSVIAKVRTVANALICRLAPDITRQLFLSSQQMLYSELNGKKLLSPGDLAIINSTDFLNPHLQTSIRKWVGKFNLKLNSKLSAHLVTEAVVVLMNTLYVLLNSLLVFGFLFVSVAATVGWMFCCISKLFQISNSKKHLLIMHFLYLSFLFFQITSHI